MAFKVGTIYGEARLDTTKWKKGTSVIGSSLKTIGKGVAVFAAAATATFTAFVVKSTKKADGFQKSLSNVNTLISEGQANIADLSGQLLRLDSSLGDTTELTDGLYQAISAGADPASEAIDVVAQSAMFAKAALTDTATAVDVLTTATNAYGSEIVNTQQASDIFFTTVKQGKITGEELASTIGQSIPLFASLGVPLEELSSGLAAMTKQGISSANATTQLNAIMNSFLKPSEEMTEALKDIGFESGSAFIEAEGLEGALKFLEEQTGGNADELAKLLPNVRALRGAMALTGAGGEEFANIMQEMNDVTGATEEAFQKQEKTFDTLKNTFGKTQVIVGNVAKSFADDMAGGLTASLNALNNFLLSSEGFETIANIISKAAGAFSIFKNILQILFEAVMEPGAKIIDEIKEFVNDMTEEVNGAWDAFDALSVAITLVSGGFKLLATWIGGNINFLGNLITSLVKTGKMFNTMYRFMEREATWEEVKAQAEETALAFLESGEAFVGTFTEIIETGKDLIKKFGQEQQDNADQLRDDWIESSTEMKNMVLSNYNEMLLGVNSGVDEMLLAQEQGMEQMTITVWDGTQKMTMTWDDYLNTVADVGTESGKIFGENFKKALEKFLTKFDDVVKPVLNKVNFVVGQIGDAFSSVFGVVDGFMEQELAKIEEQGSKELEALQLQKEERLLNTEDEFTRQEDSLAQKRERDLISQEEFDIRKAELEQRRANKTASIEKDMDDKIARQKKAQNDKVNAQKKKMFNARKANQIAEIWVQYALGLVALWTQSIAQLGPLAGSIFAGIMTGVLTGLAISNTVLVSQQSYIPEKAKGGMASGLTRIHEKGGEIVSLPDGSQVIPNDISRQIAANAGAMRNYVVNNYFKGAMISDKFSLQAIADFINRSISKNLRLQT